jgi:hypothetical protein
MQPVRIQRKRTAGYDMQAASRAANGLDCIPVTRPGRWGDPYDVKTCGRELSMALFRNSMSGFWFPNLLKDKPDRLVDLAYSAHIAFQRRFKGEGPLSAARSELAGHNLSCYCSPSEACHADLLLEIANGES